MLSVPRGLHWTSSLSGSISIRMPRSARARSSAAGVAPEEVTIMPISAPMSSTIPMKLSAVLTSIGALRRLQSTIIVVLAAPKIRPRTSTSIWRERWLRVPSNRALRSTVAESPARNAKTPATPFS